LEVVGLFQVMGTLPFKNYAVASFLVNILIIFSVILAQRFLPPEVPLFYGLAEGGDLAPLLGNIGGAKFDLTGIAYTGRPMIKKAGKIIGFDFTVLIRALVENVENLRLILIRPSLQEERLEQAVSSLNRSFDNLDIAITGTGFK